MSKTIQKGYSMLLEVANVGSIKPVASGTFRNDSGETIKYKASIQFRSTNIEEVEDEELGLKEVETHVEVKIPCEETAHVKQINEFLREYKKSGEVFTMTTSMPRQADGNIFKVVCTMTAIEFISHMTKNKKPTK